MKCRLSSFIGGSTPPRLMELTRMMWGESERCGPGQCNDGCVGRGIGAVGFGCPMGRSRGDVDDGSAAPACIRGKWRLHAQKGRRCIDFLEELPLFDAQFVQRTDTNDSRVVDQRLGPAFAFFNHLR